MEAFAQKSDLCCVAFAVEGENLWVCPQQLSLRSPVLKEVFLSAIRNRESEDSDIIIPVPDTSLDAFVPFLRYLTEDRCSVEEQESKKEAGIISNSNCPGLLNLADRFQIETLTHLAENFLLRELKSGPFQRSSDKQKNLLEILSFSEKYNLESAEECVKQEIASVWVDYQWKFWAASKKQVFPYSLLKQFQDKLEDETLREIVLRKLEAEVGIRKHNSSFGYTNVEAFNMLRFLERINFVKDLQEGDPKALETILSGLCDDAASMFFEVKLSSDGVLSCCPDAMFGFSDGEIIQDQVLVSLLLLRIMMKKDSSNELEIMTQFLNFRRCLPMSNMFFRSALAIAAQVDQELIRSHSVELGPELTCALLYTKIQQVTEKNEKLTAELEAAKRSATSQEKAGEEKEMLMSDLEASNQRNTSLYLENGLLRQEISRAERRNEAQSRSITQCRQEQDSLQRKVRSLENHTRAMENQKRGLSKTVGNLQRVKNEQASRIATLEQDNENAARLGNLPPYPGGFGTFPLNPAGGFPTQSSVAFATQSGPGGRGYGVYSWSDQGIQGGRGGPQYY